ncbi:MAG TPA: chalcone isomerase family protein [Gallionella sp.]|nr:chalcone isomerase family protein [Gallionella sp.]
MKQMLLALLLCLTSVQASALDLAGAKVEDQAQVAGRKLVLNGAGVRSVFILDLYVAALYLPEKTKDAAAVLADGGEKRMALHLLRDIEAEHLSGSLSKAIAANHTAEELTALDAPLKEFNAIFQAIKELKKGDVITLDNLPGSGTQVALNGVAKGSISGAAFNGALLKVWLGNKPAQTKLKQKLLGE